MAEVAAVAVVASGNAVVARGASSSGDSDGINGGGDDDCGKEKDVASRRGEERRGSGRLKSEVRMND